MESRAIAFMGVGYGSRAMATHGLIYQLVVIPGEIPESEIIIMETASSAEFFARIGRDLIQEIDTVDEVVTIKPGVKEITLDMDTKTQETLLSRLEVGNELSLSTTDRIVIRVKVQ